MSERESRNAATLRRLLVAAASMVGLLLIVMAVLAWVVDVTGAVVAQGTLAVETNLKKVQHPSGGVVGAILVSDGSHVEAGDLLIRLDETVARANLGAINKALHELNARRARLEAERDGADAVTFPQDLLAAAEKDPEIARMTAGELKLFAFRAEALAGQRAQLKERIAQLEEEIRGIVDQASSKDVEGGLVREELAGVRVLWNKNLVQLSRMTALSREAARIDGERGRLIASKAQTRGKIAETELQITQLAQNLRSEVGKELGDIRAKIAELLERRVTALDQVERLEIRAPRSGLVHELSVHTKGGVIAAGEQIMLIVPDSDKLVVEVRVAPREVDQIRPGVAALLRFPNFDPRSTPEINGSVRTVAADTTENPRSGEPYFLVRIALGHLRPADEARLLPGMPVEAFIQTEQRSLLAYLLKPVADQVRHAFHER